MRCTWDELPEKAKHAIRTRRFDNEKAAGLWYALVTIEREDEDRTFAEYLADATSEAEVEALYLQRDRARDRDLYDIPDTDDRTTDDDQDDDEGTMH